MVLSVIITHFIKDNNAIISSTTYPVTNEKSKKKKEKVELTSVGNVSHNNNNVSLKFRMRYW
jgi:hypothetical protein